MPRNVYSEINLHLTWHTKDNAPVLDDTVAAQCHRYLRHRAVQTEGVVVHAVNGTPDHVHLAMTVPPTVLISDWVGALKGACAHYINHEIRNRKVLEWQSGYGVVSFGTRDLPWVVRYVEGQRAHHASGGVFDRLERIERGDRAEEPR